jgi:pyridoxamine 5'-phosphate oxidase
MSEELDPFDRFERWLGEARQAGAPEPAAMALATVGRDGTPAARMVIMRGFDRRGFVFYTDCESPKGRELEASPRAALVFYWSAVSRQVRVLGDVSRLSAEESGRYFASRPRGAQVAAWIPQSRVIESRAALEEEFGQLQERFREGDVPRPPFWEGYRVAPDEWEFWESGEHRLHDRARYRRGTDGGWAVERLTP